MLRVRNNIDFPLKYRNKIGNYVYADNGSVLNLWYSSILKAVNRNLYVKWFPTLSFSSLY